MSAHPHSPDQDPEFYLYLQNPKTNPDPVLEMPNHREEPPESPEDLTLELTHPQNPKSEQEQVDEDDIELPTPQSHAKASRRGGGAVGKKGKKKRAAHEKKSLKKVEALINTLKPIPFLPVITLDFSSHEKLLKRLGLWDFVHLKFESTVRTDLIVQLIATYNPQLRSSYVNGARIMVNRADLARALKLPLKKDKDKERDRDDSVEEVEESKESVGFIVELVYNWFLLHEDTWIMPAEVLNWVKMINDGHLEKVEWATLMWLMVEKELTAAPQLTNCFYASHLQYLIKCQKEELFFEELEMEVDVKEETKDDDKEEEEGEHGEDVKLADNDAKVVDGVDEFQVGPSVELSLGGQENATEIKDDEKEVTVDDDLMDFELSKGEENHQWSVDGKSNVAAGSEHFLRPCCHTEDSGVIVDVENKEDRGERCEEERPDQEEEEEEEVEGEEDDERFPLSLKHETLDGVTSAKFLDAMETAQLPFDADLQMRENSFVEFLGSKVETQMPPGSSSFFCNGNKRGAGHENDISNHSHNVNSKRLRTDEPWDDKPFDLDGCMEQIQHLCGKARMFYAAKEHSLGELSMNQHLMVEELHQRKRIIEHLQKSKLEEQQKRHVEVHRLEREIYTMANLSDGYRKALKETNRAFSEYRARCPQHDEPLYKDVKGSGGLVLSCTELEKQRLKKEEDERMNRLSIEKKIRDFEAEWNLIFETHQSTICLLGDRLTGSENLVKHIKELFMNSKVSDVPDETEVADVPNETEAADVANIPDALKVPDEPNMPDSPKVLDAPNVLEPDLNKS